MADDHFSDIHKVVLIRSTTQEERLDTKLSVENFFQQHGRDVKSWHTDNERYAEKNFKGAVNFTNQTLSFCGVRAHHQNDIAEATIKKNIIQAAFNIQYKELIKGKRYKMIDHLLNKTKK